MPRSREQLSLAMHAQRLRRNKFLHRTTTLSLPASSWRSSAGWRELLERNFHFKHRVGDKNDDERHRVWSGYKNDSWIVPNLSLPLFCELISLTLRRVSSLRVSSSDSTLLLKGNFPQPFFVDESRTFKPRGERSSEGKSWWIMHEVQGWKSILLRSRLLLILAWTFAKSLFVARGDWKSSWK